MSGPRSRPLATAGLALAATLVGLGLLEAAARLLRPGGGGKERAEDRYYTQYDPLLGWRKLPGARVTYDRREYKTELLVNSKGLRDVERTYEPGPGAWRIVSLGDSFLEGYTVPLESTVTRVLESELRSTGCGADVVNGGTLAYSTDQEYLFYTSEGRRYRPRLVLLFFYYNDVYFNDVQSYFGRFKPVLDATADGGLRPRHYPVKPPAAEAAPEAAAPGARAERGSALLSWLADLLEQKSPAWRDRLAGLGLLAPLRRQGSRPELRVYRPEPPEELERAWDKTGLILRHLRAEAAADGARLAVVYVPSRMEVHEDSWATTQRAYGLRPGQWSRGAVVARLRRFARQDGYPVIDLTPALRAADDGWRRRPYLITDGHWSAHGHAVAASAIREGLASLDLLAGCRP